MTITENLARADGQRADLVRIIGEINSLGQTIDSSRFDELEGLRMRVDSEVFRIMVTGDFKRGKSTLLNALLGEDVLPSDPSPATAVVTEVSYSPEPRVRLWPVDENADPEDVHFTELEARIKVDNDDPDAESPYRLAEVGWDLALCENGVVVIDSPGLNEHPVRQEVTVGYLRRADAVIFLFDATMPVSMPETDFITRYLEAHDILFVVNKLNWLPEGSHENVKQNIRTRISKVRPEGRYKLFFVNALAGVDAKLQADTEAWETSGMKSFEDGLTSFLLTERHKAKVLVPAREVQRVIHDLMPRVREQEAMLEADLADLESRFNKAQQPLADLERHAQQIESSLRLRFQTLAEHLQFEVRGFLDHLATDMPALVAAADVEDDLSILKLKSSAESYARSLGEVASLAASERFDEWSKETLHPDLDQRLGHIADEFNQQLERYFKEVSEVREAVTGVESAISQRVEPFTEILSNYSPSGISRVDGIGSGATVKVIAGQLLMAITASLIFVASPVGLISFFVTVIAGGSFMKRRATKKIEDRIRAALGEELTNELRAKAADDAAKAARLFAEEIKPIETAVKLQIEGETTELRAQVGDALQAKQDGSAAVAVRRQELNDATNRLHALGTELDDLMHDVALG